MPFKKEAMQAAAELREEEVVEKIAIAFLAGLVEHLPKVTALRVRNANDYCDANMVMDAAFKQCGYETFTPEGTLTDETILRFNAAWARAIQIAHQRGRA